MVCQWSWTVIEIELSADPFAKEFDIGYEQGITHELDLCAKSRCQLLPRAVDSTIVEMEFM